eukprot:5921654-Pleurochrysis_carterae.AAC.1
MLQTPARTTLRKGTRGWIRRRGRLSRRVEEADGYESECCSDRCEAQCRTTTLLTQGHGNNPPYLLALIWLHLPFLVAPARGGFFLLICGRSSAPRAVSRSTPSGRAP